VFLAKKRYSSAPKTGEIFHRKFVREYGINFAVEVKFNNENTLFCAVKNGTYNFIRIEMFPSFEGRGGLRPRPMTPHYFVRIFFHLR